MLKPILLVEDNPNDLELTLIALSRSQLANEVIIARDGAEALDYLNCRGQFAKRQAGINFPLSSRIDARQREPMEQERMIKDMMG